MEIDEVASAERMVVGDGGLSESTEHADRITSQNFISESEMTFRLVAPIPSRTSPEVSGSSMIAASRSLDRREDGWTSSDRADAHVASRVGCPCRHAPQKENPARRRRGDGSAPLFRWQHTHTEKELEGSTPRGVVGKSDLRLQGEDHSGGRRVVVGGSYLLVSSEDSVSPADVDGSITAVEVLEDTQSLDKFVECHDRLPCA